MHAYKTLPKLWAKRLGGGGNDLGGNGIGGETTRVLGAKRPRVKIEAKRLGGKRLGGGGKRLGSETTWYPCQLGRVNSACLTRPRRHVRLVGTM